MESIFYLFRITGDSYYRNVGWDLIRSIHKHTHVDSGGYTSVGNVNDPSGSRLGTQESFFMAETLKYAYLLFSDPRFMSLDEWVFNTEAHPFRILSKS
ncbi:hypothetical protein MXB_3636 [Myxobolus squamalis]|nr:hypothetical protein MXB_3636 [Myxobolus squamalis]